MTRYRPLDRLTLDRAQQRVCDQVRAGRRGTVPANVVAWLASPELAARAAHLGEFLRYETSLAPALSELAILVVARHWSCGYEWAVHAVEAAGAGVAADTVEAIAAGRTPALEPAASAVVEVTGALVAGLRLDDGLYARAVAALGETGFTELVGLVGYYTLVAFTLNAREVPAPEGAPVLPPRVADAG